MKRPLILGLLLVLGLWSVAVIVPWDLPDGVTRADLRACQGKPDTDCVVDIGIALLRDRQDPPAPRRWLAPLAMLGRIDAAEALIAQQVESRGIPPGDAAAEARKTTLRFRLLRDLRSGASLEEALAKTPEADGSDLWIVGLELLHRNPYGLPRFGDRTLPTESEYRLVAAIASRIIAWNKAQPQRARDYQLRYAANLRAALGDREGTIEVLGEMNARGVRSVLRPEVFQVAGPGAVLALADPSDSTFPSLLRQAGEAEQDATEAAQHFTRAFDLHAGETPWPDFGKMLRVVKATSDRGLVSDARVLADRMLQLANDNTDAPFHVFHRLYTAQALFEAGASRDVVSEQIAIALSQFPSDGSEIIGVGWVWGPIRWEASGLADNARTSIAGLSAQIGDVETAVAILGQATDPVQTWTGLTNRNLSVATLETLREAASHQLSAPEAAYVASRLASMALFFHRGADHDAWALRVARDLGADPQAMEQHGVAWAVARISLDQGDDVLGHAALETLARIELDRRDGVQLIRTGYMMAATRP